MSSEDVISWDVKKSGRQYDPITFMTKDLYDQDYGPPAEDRWSVRKHITGNYIITSHDGQFILDGSTDAPQIHRNHPTPFLNTHVGGPYKPGSLWILKKTKTDGVYFIINQQSGLCLDGNVRAVNNKDQRYRSAFLHKPELGRDSHLWKMVKLPKERPFSFG